jgi:hypothetical protein
MNTPAAGDHTLMGAYVSVARIGGIICGVRAPRGAGVVAAAGLQAVALAKCGRSQPGCSSRASAVRVG